jgi:hypothetical protein
MAVPDWPNSFGYNMFLFDTAKVEVFSAGCPACKETIELLNRVACSSCEVTVLDMQDTRIATTAPEMWAVVLAA